MVITENNIEKLLRKKVFARKAPMNSLPPLDIITNINEKEIAGLRNDLSYLKISQEQLTNELDPNSHDINNIAIYPDKIKDVKKDGRVIGREIIAVSRVSLPLQEFIANRQAIHLWGNPLTFNKFKSDDNELFTAFKEYWKFKGTDEAALSVVKSVKKTGDGALLFFFDEFEELTHKVFSFLLGDILIPHYQSDGVTLDAFCRRFLQTDPETGKGIDALEVYDSTHRYLFHNKDNKWVQKAKDEHGFGMCPIAYYREEDSAWGCVQDLIDKLERSLSDYRDSNSYFTYGILFLAGGQMDVLPPKTTQGKVITSNNENAKASLIEQGDVAHGFNFEYETYLQQIKDLTGTVIIDPEDFKGGDVSGATIKSYYDPAIQQAILSKPMIQPFIKQLIRLTKVAYGSEVSDAARMNKMRIRGDIDIYVPRNAHEENEMVCRALEAGCISQQTATERIKLGASDEWERVQSETALKDAAALALETAKSKAKETVEKPAEKKEE